MIYVAVGYKDAGGGHAITSPDAITWTTRTTPDYAWFDLVFGGDQFVALGWNAPEGTSIGAVATSPDGVTWTFRASHDHDWQAIAYGAGMYVAVGYNEGFVGQIMTSPDAITWTMRTSPIGTAWGVITFGDGQFVCVTNAGTNGTLITSPDGITWTVGTSINWTWADIAYGAGLYVVVGNNPSGGAGAVMTSPDAVTWTARTCPNHTWKGVTYDSVAGQFVAVAATGGGTGGVMTSPDGITWTDQTPAAGEYYAVITGDGLYVAVGFDSVANGEIMSSPDGESWTARTNAAPNGGWSAIAFNPGDGSGPDPGPGPDPAPGAGDDYPPGHTAYAGGLPTDGATWLYDGSTGFWSKLKSFQISRHRVQFSFQLDGQTIGCDYFNGKLYRITDTAYSDNGRSIEGEIVGETVALPDEASLSVNKVRVVMETGVGTPVGQGVNPQVSLSLSRDNGRTWGAEMWRTMGAVGEYQTRIEWRRLGTTRWLTAKIRITDPVKRVITGASINPSD